MVGALTPIAFAASSRVRASLCVADVSIAPGCTGAALIISSIILFVGLLTPCDQSLLMGDRSHLSTGASAQPLDYKPDNLESDRSQIGHLWAILSQLFALICVSRGPGLNCRLFLSAYPHANRIGEKELPFRKTTLAGNYFERDSSNSKAAMVWLRAGPSRYCSPRAPVPCCAPP